MMKFRQIKMYHKNSIKQHKKNFLKISIKYKIWLAIMTTVLVIIGTLWLLQVVFLEDYYLKIKSADLLNNTKEIANSIDEKGLKGAADDITRIGNINTLCIDISNQNGLTYVELKGHEDVSIKVRVVNMAVNNEGKYIKAYIKHPRFGTDFNTCAILHNNKDGTRYVIIVTTTIAPIKEAIKIIKNQLIYISILLVLVATAIAFLLARTLTKPILKISNAAMQIANGNLDVDVWVKSNDELGKLSESFSYMTKEIAKVNVLQKELVANISHDMRTPLTMIKGYAEAIKDITGDNKEMREHQLDIIVEETNRLSTLVTDVMDLSLMQAGQAKINIKPFDIAKKAREILGRFELLEQTSGFTFLINSDHCVMVNGDEVRIEQVLYNLINNAVNHIGEQKHINVAIIPFDTSIRIEVTDTGKGIEQTDLPLIWDRYYKPYKKTEQKAIGTGLGLSIVKAILINHNSNFGVISTIGKGSTFWFTLEKSELE